MKRQATFWFRRSAERYARRAVDAGYIATVDGPYSHTLEWGRCWLVWLKLKTLRLGIGGVSPDDIHIVRQEGLILHGRTQTRAGALIRYVLKSWGCHDALVIEKGDRWYIGDTVPIFARLTPIEQWEADLADGRKAAWILQPIRGDADLGHHAAQHWIRNCHGRLYDFVAFPRLLLKAWLGDRWNRAAGWTWAKWCTEGVSESWRYAGLDLYHGRNNPTPLSTEHELDPGGSLKLIQRFDNPRTGSEVDHGQGV